MNIPLSQPDITSVEIEAVVAVLKSTQLSLGPKLEEFEQRVAAYICVPHAIAVSSGTAGLHLALLALRIGPGDEVLVPSFSFIAAANVIRYTGAMPVFVDIDATTLNLDPSLVEAAITPRTRAMMVVHTFGRPADMDALQSIARRHKLLLIEDACEAIGAEYRGRKVGSFGSAGVFAFYPNKQITTGEGGIIVTEDTAIARELRALRNQGRYPSDSWHQHSILGYNYRLSEINCALGCAQMTRIAEILRKRTAAAESYRQLLQGLPSILLPNTAANHEKISWFVYVVRLESAMRDRVLHSLQKAGIQCGRYFAPIHHQPAYANYKNAFSLPITEAESLRCLALPFFSNITREQIEYVARYLQQCLC